MIDDIVLLPRRLKQFKRDADVSSELSCCVPLSNIPRLVGFESPCDDSFVQCGTRMRLITGNDTMFRFKLIENTINGIIEYYCLSESPIDVLSPRKSKNALVYCPWISITDPKTFKQRRYVFWEHVRALMRFEVDETNDIPFEVAIAEELRAFGSTIYGCPELLDAVKDYPGKRDIVRISEIKPGVDPFDMYMTIGSNIRALSEIYAVDDSIHSPDPINVLREVELPEKWTDVTPLKRSTVVHQLIWGPMTIKEMMFMFSQRYALHCFQRGFNMQPLPEDTEIDIHSDDEKSIFSIIEYVGAIPYGEFELTVKANSSEFTKFNPFDMNALSRCIHADHVDDCPEVTKIISNIRSVLTPETVSVTIARSWAEEVYITFVDQGCKRRRFYADLSIDALCSRSLFRDYQVPLFTFG